MEDSDQVVPANQFQTNQVVPNQPEPAKAQAQPTGAQKRRINLIDQTNKSPGCTISGQFIEIRELLGKNIALLQQLEAMQGTTPIAMYSSTHPRLREVSSLLTRPKQPPKGTTAHYIGV